MIFSPIFTILFLRKSFGTITINTFFIFHTPFSSAYLFGVCAYPFGVCAYSFGVCAYPFCAFCHYDIRPEKCITPTEKKKCKKNDKSGFEIRKPVLDIYKCPKLKRAGRPLQKSEKSCCDHYGLLSKT